jgi:hypothetical protein
MQRYRDYFYTSITITTDMIPSLKPHWILLFSILALVHMPANGQSKKKQIVSLNVTIDSLENALSQSKGKILSLEQQMNDNEAKSEKEINKLKGELQELQTQLQQTQEAKEVLEGKFNLKMEEHSKEKSNLNNTIELLKKKIDILQIALDETNNQLVQLQKKTIEMSEKFLRVLSDSARNATLISELIPENCVVHASEIFDIDGDFIDDFVVIYQDTMGLVNSRNQGDSFDHPIILEIFLFNRNSKSLDKKIQSIDLISSLFFFWGNPYSEDIGIEFYRTDDEVILKINHRGLSTEIEGEDISFNYNRTDHDFHLTKIECFSFSRIDNDHPMTQLYLADFEKKIIEDYNKPKRRINFEAPTLSSWPNGNWKFLGWKSE